MYKKYINRAINPVFFAFKHLSQQVSPSETREICLPTLIFTIQVLNVQAQDISLITLNHLPAPNAQATNHTAQAEKYRLPFSQRIGILSKREHFFSNRFKNII